MQYIAITWNKTFSIGKMEKIWNNLSQSFFDHTDLWSMVLCTHFFFNVKCFDESEFQKHANGRHEHFVVVKREIVKRQWEQIQRISSRYGQSLQNTQFVKKNERKKSLKKLIVHFKVQHVTRHLCFTVSIGRISEKNEISIIYKLTST